MARKDQKNEPPKRKYGKNETTLSNVLKLVKALLALADGEIAVLGDKLKATFKVEWVKEDELLVSGKVQEERNNRTKTVEKGITKEDLCTLVECLGEALELPQPKDEKKKPTEAERKANAIQDILYCLEYLHILARKPSAITKGFWKFSLKLKHQTASKEDNLKVIKEQWKIKIGSVTVETSHETPKPEDEPLNWQEICRQNLALQKQLTTNPFTNANGVTPQLDEVYVPLAIERKPPKPPSRNQPEEKPIPIAEESFFEDVLRQGKSDISQGRKIAIIGEPGSGKTTRLQKIADWILKPDQEDLGFPIWIDLADLDNQNICKYLENEWLSKCKGGVKRSDLEPQISRAWLLLDGVDEMSHTQRMEQLAKDLSSSWVQAARVVVTCRVNVWEADKNAFSGFDVFHNLPFKPEQVTDYIRRWFAGMEDAATGESLEAALAESENSRLKELIQNPLRLWMLCQIWQTGGGLPETQAGLYGQFVDWVYDWKADEEILDQREAIDKALAQLALAAMEQKDEVSRLRLRESWVLKVLGSRPIFQAVMKLGWLNRVERFPEAICVFYHATFQEYFTALAVDDWDYFLPRNHVNFPVAEKEYRIFEPQWKQVILLWLGRGDVKMLQKEEFIKKLVEFNDGLEDCPWYWLQANFIAAAGIAEFEPDHRIADIIIKRIIYWSLFDEYQISENPRCFMVSQAKKALQETNHIKVLNTLIHRLDTGDNNIRRLVADLILKINPDNTKAVQTLIQLLSTSNYHDEQATIIGSLAKVRVLNSELSSILKQLLMSQDEYIRYLTASRLTKTESDQSQAIKVLKNLLGTGVNDFAAHSLKQVAPDVPVTLIFPEPYSDEISFTLVTSRLEILGLGKFDLDFLNSNFQNIVNLLINFIHLSQDRKEREDAVRSLSTLLLSKKFSNRHELFPSVVTGLKIAILDRVYTNDDFDTYNAYGHCYDILWHCAQNLPYSDFYRAWHGLTETQTSPLIQTLNLAQLPQLLQTQLTETNLHQTLQLLCIDGSKFDNRDNPATDIYLQLVKKHHCPKSTEGTPRTLTELKIYWQLLDWEKHPILIFYEDAIPQGFSQTFLDFLTRFDATICVIADSPHPTIPTFSPQDTHLIQSIMNWLQRTVLEA